MQLVRREWIFLERFRKVLERANTDGGNLEGDTGSLSHLLMPGKWDARLHCGILRESEAL